VSQKTTQLWNGIAWNYKDRFDDIRQKYLQDCRIEFACFSFHVGLPFYQLFVFQTGYRKYTVTRILTLYQANAATLTLFTKGDKILIKNLHECKGCNARQFITKFLNKGWAKTALTDWRSLEQSTRVLAAADAVRVLTIMLTQLICCCWVKKTNFRANKQSEKFHARWGNPSVISFADYSQRSASQGLQEKTRSTADWSAQHAHVIFGMQFKRR